MATPDNRPAQLNVLGTPLKCCCLDPLTGFYRNGRCETGPEDMGSHTVCARVTDAFLQFSVDRGNDLVTPRPEFRFRGLKDGDRWCLCLSRWLEALEEGMAPPIELEGTHEIVLEKVELEVLQRHAWIESGAQA